MPLSKDDCVQNIEEHFSKPGAQFAWRPMTESRPGACVYRGNKDPKSPIRCGIGVQIPDEMYRPEWDDDCGRTICSIIAENPELRALFDEGVGGTWLSHLQQLHDLAVFRSDTIEQYLNAVREFRANY